MGEERSLTDVLGQVIYLANRTPDMMLTSGRAGARPSVDPGDAGIQERMRCGVECRARRHDIVDECDVRGQGS